MKGERSREVLWSNYPNNEFYENIIEGIRENALDHNDLNYAVLCHPEVTLYDEVNVELEFLFEDLHHATSASGLHDIIVIANLGLWDGRRLAYKELNGKSFDEMFYTKCDYATWYVDGWNNLKFEGAHHDGCNYYLYREWKDNISDEQRENFKEKLWSGTATAKDITRYTKSIGAEVKRLIDKWYTWNPEESV